VGSSNFHGRGRKWVGESSDAQTEADINPNGGQRYGQRKGVLPAIERRERFKGEGGISDTPFKKNKQRKSNFAKAQRVTPKRKATALYAKGMREQNKNWTVGEKPLEFRKMTYYREFCDSRE